MIQYLQISNCGILPTQAVCVWITVTAIHAQSKPHRLVPSHQSPCDTQFYQGLFQDMTAGADSLYRCNSYGSPSVLTHMNCFTY